MNANQLFTGEHYAWRANPPKGRIPIDAKKVRLRHTEQRKRSTMQNRHTVAAITVVETGQEYDVPAREIIMFWDEYEHERDHLLEERRKNEMANKRITLRRTVIESIITYRLSERQIPLSPVIHGNTAYIDTEQLTRWLDVTEEDIQNAVDRAMVAEYGEK